MLKKFLSANFLLILIILLASALRLYKLSANPPALFGDELDTGYQAYSILKTGRDYQGNFMPIQFHSIAEWRTPLYVYTIVPTVALFGITPLGVRLPAAVFGILTVLIIFLVVKELLNFGQEAPDNHPAALLAALLMAISPWSLQFSRSGFEVTEMIFLLMSGLWLFFKALKDPKWLWLSLSCFILSLWGYPTTKVFVPLLIISIFILFKREILKMPKKSLALSVIAALIIGIPITFSTFFGGGSKRINDISILTDPNMETVVGTARDLDRKAGTPSVISKLVNNKFTYFGGEVVNNYFQSFSTEFLFLKGDINMRQGVGMGELYLMEMIPLLLGLGYFFLEKNRDKKIKLLMIFWLLIGAFPSALTINGGTHATRLFLILPALLFFISFGWVSLYREIQLKYKTVFAFAVSALYLVSFIFYFHQYYAVYPVVSESWWHYGWAPAVSTIKSIDPGYDKVIISMSGEPAWIFFAADYEYPPDLWQKHFPIGNDIYLDGFGTVSHTGKFYFGSPDNKIQIYGIGKYIDAKTLYLANAEEHGDNLLLHPDKVPAGLKLLKTVQFPSGNPAFYLFAGTVR